MNALQILMLIFNPTDLRHNMHKPYKTLAENMLKTYTLKLLHC